MHSVCLPCKATHRVHHCFHLRLSSIWVIQALDDNICHISKKKNFSLRGYFTIFNCRVTLLALFSSGIKSPNVMSSDRASCSQIFSWSAAWHCVTSDETFVKRREQARLPTTLQSFSVYKKFDYGESFHSYLHFYFKLLWNVLKQRGQWNSPWARPRPHDSKTSKLQKAKMPDWQMKSSQELQHFVAVGNEKLPIVDNRLLKIRIVPYWTNN